MGLVTNEKYRKNKEFKSVNSIYWLEDGTPLFIAYQFSSKTILLLKSNGVSQ